MRPRDDLSAIIESIDVEAFCDRQGIAYRKTSGSSGAQLNIKACPRCGGSGWKVFLNADSGLGSCFHGSCVGQPGFNLFSFTRSFLKITPRETAELLRTFAGEVSHMTRFQRTAKAVAPRPASSVTLPESTPISVSFQIPYLANRGLTHEDCAYFGLRYSEKGTFAYEGEGRTLQQDYAGRVIIPIHNLAGELVTFQGRATDKTALRKYLFPPGLAGSGRYLYNAHRCTGIETLVMGEGVFDAIAAYKALGTEKGVGVIASFGMHLSGDHTGRSGSDDQASVLLELKKRGLKRLVIMWDGSASAIAAACKAAVVVNGLGIQAAVALLPRDKDPNEVTAEAVRVAYVRALVATRANLGPLILSLAMYRKRTINRGSGTRAFSDDPMRARPIDRARALLPLRGQLLAQRNGIPRLARRVTPLGRQALSATGSAWNFFKIKRATSPVYSCHIRSDILL